MKNLATALMLTILVFSIACASSQKVEAQGGQAVEESEVIDTRTAFEQLEQATRFAPGAVGYAGHPSTESLAFRTLLQEGDSKEKFVALYESENPAAKLYGLAGMYFSDKSGFDNEVALLKANTALVDTQMGCSGGRSTVGALVAGEGGVDFESGVISLMLSGDSKKLYEAGKALEEQ